MRRVVADYFEDEDILTSSAPDELTTRALDGVIAIEGWGRFDAMRLAGKLRGHFGKALLLRGIDKGQLVVKVPPRGDHVSYFLFLVNTKGESVGCKMLAINANVIHTWTVVTQGGRVRLNLTKGTQSVAKLSLAETQFSAIGFAATTRYIGDHASLSILLNAEVLERLLTTSKIVKASRDHRSESDILSSFGGTGEHGDFAPSPEPGRIVTLDTTDFRHGMHYRRFVVPQTILLRIKGPHPARIHATESIRVDGTIEIPAQHAPPSKSWHAGKAPTGVCGGYNGGQAVNFRPWAAACGQGPGRGEAPRTICVRSVHKSSGGGGGGGFGKAGRGGGRAHEAGGKGGRPYGEAEYPKLQGGSGGAGGGESQLARSVGGSGGAGGGVLYLSSAGEVVINGRLRANGGNGAAGSRRASGGGGGSGGMVVLRSMSAVRVHRAAAVEVLGGRGGKGHKGGAKGGDGGLGRIVIECPTRGRQLGGRATGAVTHVDLLLSQ